MKKSNRRIAAICALLLAVPAGAHMEARKAAGTANTAIALLIELMRHDGVMAALCLATLAVALWSMLNLLTPKPSYRKAD